LTAVTKVWDDEATPILNGGHFTVIKTRKSFMSADNGIYIAKFPDGWRVIHAQAIDNINYHPKGSKAYFETLNQYFGGAMLYPVEDDAWKFARQLLKQYSYVEYGIQYIDELPSLKPKKRLRVR
jgi:hypothetical protein